jgi:Winged helix DNA-binding domain
VTEIAARRLRAQRLVGEPFDSAVAAVRWLGAVQSQDFGGAKWALAQRTTGATDAELDRLFDEGAILRTHLMRPTWHFVLPEDVRWLLELTSPRLMAGMAGRHRQLELDQHTRARATDLFAEALGRGHFLTRDELAGVLRAAGISPEGQRLPHMLAVAEAQGVIVSGPRRGKQFTYALLEGRVPAARRLDRDEGLAELTSRYFRSHGPAQIQDFAWWSGLTVADIKRGLAHAGSALDHHAAGGKDYWFDSESAPQRKPPQTAHLLPNFDEFTVAYRDRGALLDPELPFDPQGGILSNVVTVGGIVRGSWRRTLTPKAVRVEVRLLGALVPAVRTAVERAAEQLGRFLERKADLRVV